MERCTNNAWKGVSPRPHYAELGYDASMVKKLDKEELEGYDAVGESGVPAGVSESVKA